MTASDLAGLLPLVLIIVVFYFLLIRPQRNRQREVMRTQSQIAPGQDIITTAGLHATVVAVDEDTVTLETSPGVTSRWARAAVARVVSPVEPGESYETRSPQDTYDDAMDDERRDQPGRDDDGEPPRGATRG